MQRPAPSPLKQHWLLDPDVIFLNHGSFGACPRKSLDLQQELRNQLERQPVRFFIRAYEPLLDQARLALAAFLRADPEGLAFVPNATHGVNTVLRCFPFQKGDQILITDHGYNACNNAARFVAQQHGAEVVVAPLPFPVQDPQQLHDAILQHVTTRTKLVLIDHITSPTALILPVQTLVPALRSRGIKILIDGAHAPGMLPLHLSDLDPDFYTGNCHKWMCAPKGAAFLYVREAEREDLRPLSISHGENDPRSEYSRFRLRFDWTGTTDPTPFLCLPHAIDFLPQLLGLSWEAIMQANHQKVCMGRKILSDALGLPLLCPDALLGSMAALPLPPRDPQDLPNGLIDPLQERLFQQHDIEVPVTSGPVQNKRLLRISAQAYNTQDEYTYLAHVLG
ncbi:MAG: aminotransferase class V-fold PLP-dependent enzyme [Myxococcales bacterium]|nr:aminotransferase class V-fold PLP-dependent enzyme [Myxococcales bacterium]MCB9644259.1 aminotransferase class V-fold PLP-dependent enzyme [Myxococcales bacterium]